MIMAIQALLRSTPVSGGQRTQGRFIHIVAAVPLYPTSQTEGDWYVGSLLRDLASLSMRQTQRGGCSYFLPYIFFFEDVGRIPE